MDYIVLFDVASKPRPWFWILALVAASVGAFFMGRRNDPDASERTRWANLVLSRMFVVGAIITLVAGGYTYESKRQRMLAALMDGNVLVVEGVISSVTRPKPLHNGPECFTVESKSFCYRSQDSTPAFNEIGGPIRKGLWIRVTYKDTNILRLETARNDSNRPDASDRPGATGTGAVTGNASATATADRK